LHQRSGGVEASAAEHAGMQVPLTRPDGDVEVDKAARGDMEHRYAAPAHGAVEDDRSVRSPLVARDEVDDLVAARLLLPVTDDPDVHGQLAGGAKQLRGLQQRIQLALVVRRSAPV
jgi:hypothetical protein